MTQSRPRGLLSEAGVKGNGSHWLADITLGISQMEMEPYVINATLKL